jgi:hypothetical protein
LYLHITPGKGLLLILFLLSSFHISVKAHTSPPADGPTIVDGPVATSRHSGNDSNQQRYGMYFSINVTDPQGTSDIATVVVTGPTSITYTLSDPETDGVWNLWTTNYDDPPATGVYTFKVTDKSGNWIEATDNISAILDYPRNVIPSQYSITSSQTPVFSWTAVSGVIGYNVVVADINGNAIWQKNGITSTSVTFNDDGSATSALVNGTIYYWEVNCSDADGNTGEQDYWVTFIYSSNTTNPYLTDLYIRSAHYGDDYGNQEYRLQLNIRVIDPQGFSDISTVKVTGTGGSVYTLTDDNSDGYYECWFSNLTSAPQAGTYIFRATDKEGNWTEKTSTLAGILDFPTNVRPLNNAVLNTTTPVFSWTTVSGAVRNEIWLNDVNGKLIWARWDLSGTTSTVTFNYDGLATEALKEGMLYSWSVRASDENGNWGEHNSRQFVYSSNAVRPIIGNHDVTTYHGGDDLGNEDWGYDLWVDIADPQGSADIASVVMTGPGGETYTLNDPENDGRYSGWARSSTQLQLGQCQFKVTDKSENSATVNDTLYAWMDYPRNLSPVSNTVATSSTPTFQWDNVAGVNYYQIHVSPAGLPPVWGGINIYSGTSVVYNYNGTGQNLKTGVVYNWDIRSVDSKGNYGYHYANSFMYSTSETAPQMVDPVAQTAHYGDDKGNESYYLIFSTRAMDPQGNDDIVSVIVTGPDQKTYSLNPGSDKTYYQLWSGGTNSVPVLGPYKFRITDKSGNFSEITKHINAVLDYPKNLSPLVAEVVNTTTPVFKWKAVAGATRYTIRVNNELNNEIWRNDNLTDTTVTYNFDNTASEAMKFGFNYIVHVNAYDDEGNFGEQNNRVFYCSQNIANPIMTANRLRSRHWADGSLGEWWGIDCSINVSDPQGINDIDSVWLEGPDNYHMRLFDNGNNGDGTAGDSRFAISSNTSGRTLTGEYIFRCRDKTGNIVSVKDTINKVLDIPVNLSIKHNSIIKDPAVLISWNSVTGATRYEVNVYSLDWSRRLWFEGKMAGLLSAVYNHDNTGSPLSEGEAYYLVIRTDDGDWGNEAEINNIKFVYRSDGRHKIYVDTSNTSGIEYGTKLKPYNTLNEAIDRTVSKDTVIVAPGIYQGGLENVGEITLIGENALSTIIKGGHVNLQSSNTTIKGFSIKESDRSAIEIYGDSNIVITNNIISDNAGHGIVNGWNGKPSKNIFIRNNTIVSNLWNGISIENDASEASIINNIVSHNGSGISINSGSPVTSSYNIVFGNNNDYLNLTAGQGDLNKDPLYTDRSNKIYTLMVISPALDAGKPDLDDDDKDWTADADDRDPDTTRMDMGAVFLDQRLLIPDVPESLTAVSCNDLVTLKWNKIKSPYFKRYRIYAGINESNLSKIDSTSDSRTDTVRVISGLNHLQTYYFRISAVSRSGKESTNGTSVSAQVQTGLVPRIKSKWSGDVLICYNPGDSVSKYQWYKNSLPVTGAISQYYEAKKQSGIYSIQTTDKNGCVNLSKTLSLSGSKSVDAYPNPSAGSFVLKIADLPEGKVTVSITDTYGRKVKEYRTIITDNETVKEIDISGLRTGIYYINVSDSNLEQTITKVIVSE